MPLGVYAESAIIIRCGNITRIIPGGLNRLQFACVPSMGRYEFMIMLREKELREVIMTEEYRQPIYIKNSVIRRVVRIWFSGYNACHKKSMKFWKKEAKREISRAKLKYIEKLNVEHERHRDEEQRLKGEIEFYKDQFSRYRDNIIRNENLGNQIALFVSTLELTLGGAAGQGNKIGHEILMITKEHKKLIDKYGEND
jgi:hypothetical protein